MQIFIIGTIIETAKCLDTKRLNKQIIEAKQILRAIIVHDAPWKNHPCSLQYKNYTTWLRKYYYCLKAYKFGCITVANNISKSAEEYTPLFHTEEFFNQMKRRLYTKNNLHYNQWKNLGESNINLYYVNGEWKKYKNGKNIK